MVLLFCWGMINREESVVLPCQTWSRLVKDYLYILEQIIFIYIFVALFEQAIEMT
jgi:hypothetical protein